MVGSVLAGIGIGLVQLVMDGVERVRIDEETDKVEGDALQILKAGDSLC